MMLLTLVAFWTLVLVGARRVERRRAYATKSLRAWILDLWGLFVQGTLVPWMELAVVVAGLAALQPQLRGSLRLPGNNYVSGFLLNMFVIDYLYYWNHRLLHTRRLWPVHMVHHTLSDMDVLGTARNTAWTTFLILYVWLNGTMLFLLERPAGYIFGAAVTASLDLWRHSELTPLTDSRLGRILGSVLILPHDHAWHHATQAESGNYGANFVFWDRLHGTWISRSHWPQQLGVPSPLPFWRQLWWPFP